MSCDSDPTVSMCADLEIFRRLLWDEQFGCDKDTIIFYMERGSDNYCDNEMLSRMQFRSKTVRKLYVYDYLNTYIHEYIHTHTHTHAHIYIHIHMYIYM